MQATILWHYIGFKLGLCGDQKPAARFHVVSKCSSCYVLLSINRLTSQMALRRTKSALGYVTGAKPQAWGGSNGDMGL